MRECCMFCSQKSMPHACSCKWMCVYLHNFKGCLLQNVRHLTYSVLFGINNTNLFQFSLTKDLLIICSHVYKFVQVCLVPAQIVSLCYKNWKSEKDQVITIQWNVMVFSLCFIKVSKLLVIWGVLGLSLYAPQMVLESWFFFWGGGLRRGGGLSNNATVTKRWLVSSFYQLWLSQEYASNAV